LLKVVLDSRRLKQINTDLVRNALKVKEFGTKNSVARDTGLSIATCGNILQEMLLEGEAMEIDFSPSTGGRPSRRFVYNEDHAFAALVYPRKESSSKSIYASVVNLRGKTRYEQFEEFEDVSLEEMEHVINGLVDKFPRIQVISLGIPAVIRNGVIGACDLEKLSHIPIKDYFREQSGRIVIVENDVNSMALGYYQRIESQRPESLVYIYYPEGGIAGAGIIVNGKILRGRTDFAGEISYMPFWISREQQGTAQKERVFAEFISDTILSINCIINPHRIVVSGQWFTDSLKSTIESHIAQASPQDHLPRIDFETDIHDSYIDGLTFSGLRKMSCGFQVIET
jgi:hypothetical protein